MIEHQTPLIQNPRRLLLELGKRHSFNESLELIVRRIAESQSVALACIWLRNPLRTTVCQSDEPNEQPDSRSLHCVSAAGRILQQNDSTVTDNCSPLDHCPVDIEKIAAVSSSGKPIEWHCINGSEVWTGNQNWLQKQGVQGFGAQPLVHRGSIFGSLGVFSFATISDDDFCWLHAIANRAAASIGNAMACEEIASLRCDIEKSDMSLQCPRPKDHTFGEIIGSSDEIRQVTRQISLVAPTDSTVLITGATGTGKELVAREIHRRSTRAAKSFVKVNCAAIPRELFDSEFFGHVKGSFTGAVQDRLGRFALSDGATLFLDEIGEIPVELQSKLLRVLQEGEFEAVGSAKTTKVDVRIIAATNRDLKAECDAKKFRTDLYYRLSVFPIEIPALAKRSGDIGLIATKLLEDLSSRIGRLAPKLSDSNIATLEAHDWPGNVRELLHVLERALITHRSGPLRFDGLEEREWEPALNNTGWPDKKTPHRVLSEHELRKLESNNIRRALSQSNGKVSGEDGAAGLLGISASTLTSRIKKFGIQREQLVLS